MSSQAELLALLRKVPETWRYPLVLSWLGVDSALRQLDPRASQEDTPGLQKQEFQQDYFPFP